MKRSFIFLLGLLCIIMVEAKNHYFKHLGVSDGLSQVCMCARKGCIVNISLARD